MPTSMPVSVARILRAIAIAAFLPSAAFAALPEGVAAGPSVEGISEYRLANGLRVLLFPDATKPTTTVNVTYLVGSRHEGYGETGMAHLLEHMLFKGTPSIPSVFAELGRRGMRFNGTTSFDRTNYYETFPASGENLDWALAMEAERMTRSAFTKAELDTEMTVVRNEYESGENDPRHVLWKRMQAVAFDWHNYGHVTIGARSDIENVPFERLRAFYSTYYQPDNAVLIVAGRFDAEPTLASIARVFGAIPRPARALPPIYTTEPQQDGEREVVVRRVGSTQLVAALYHAPPGAHPDSTAIDALGEVMTIEPAGRLYKALVESGKAASVESWSLSMHDPGTLIFWAQVPTESPLEAAQSALLATLAGVRAQPVADAEVDRIRARALKEFDQTINDPQRLGVALSEAIAQGDWRLFFLARDRWRTLKAADVQRVALEYLKPANLTLGRFVPDKSPDRAPLIASVDVPAMLKDYKGDAAVAAGEAFDPTPANLEARTERLALPNGMKLALLPKKTRGGIAQLVMRLDHGDEKSLFGSRPVGSATADMLERGTTRLSRQAYEDAVDALRAKLAVHGGEATTTVNGQTVRENVPALLRLVAEVLRTPAFDAAELATLKRESVEHLASRRTDPESIAGRALSRHDNPYPAGDVRYSPTVDEEIAQISGVTIEAVRAFHKRFYGAQNAELALVGDFDADEVKKLAAVLFADWRSEAPYARVPDPYRATTPASMRFETPDKANAMLLGKLALRLNDRAPDYAALQIADKILGASTESRLWTRIRVKDGLSYASGSGLRVAQVDDGSMLTLYAIFAPQNLDRVRQGFAEELARALADGFTADEVAAAKKALLQERQLTRAQDAALAAALTNQAWLGRTWQESARIDAEIAAVTVDSANAALRKYVDPARIAWAQAGDFPKK
jgi:zinc protease